MPYDGSSAPGSAKFTFDHVADEYLKETLTEGQDKFQLALNLKLMLDDIQNGVEGSGNEFRNQFIQFIGEYRQSTILLYAEYILYKLYADVELPQNPFLSHLIDTYIWHRDLLESKEDGKLPREGIEDAISIAEVDLYLARYTIIKYILNRNAGKRLGSMKPNELREKQPTSENRSFPVPVFYATEFVEAVTNADSAMWTNPDTLATFKDSIAPLFPSGTDLNHISAVLPTPDTSLSKADIIGRLDRDDDTVMTQLENLAITDLKNLELVSEIIEYICNPAIVRTKANRYPDDKLYMVQSFIYVFVRSGLRQVEALGRSASGSGAQSTPHDSSSVQADDDTSIMPPLSTAQSQSPTSNRREDQTRAVKLLCLFICHVLRKGYVSMSWILFEMRELSMLYIWVREARDLKDEFLRPNRIDNWVGFYIG